MVVAPPPRANSTTAQGPVRSVDGPQSSPLHEFTASKERHLFEQWNLVRFLEERNNKTLEEITVMLLGIKSSDVEQMVKILYHTSQFQQVYVCWKNVTTHPKSGMPVIAPKSKAKKSKRQKVPVHRKRAHRTLTYPTNWLKRINWRKNKIMVRKCRPAFRASLPKVPSLAEAENDRTLTPRHVGFSKSVHVRLIPPLHHDRRARISKEHQDRIFINDPASLHDREPVQEHVTESCQQREQSILSRTIRCIIECLCCSQCCTTGGEN